MRGRPESAESLIVVAAERYQLPRRSGRLFRPGS